MANKIETTLAAVNNAQDIALITGKNSIYPFENGKRISDVSTGTKYNVALQGNRLSPLSIKIDGADPLPSLTDEQIEASTRTGKFIFLRFIDCKVSIYTMNGQMGMTATATGVEPLNSSK